MNKIQRIRKLKCMNKYLWHIKIEQIGLNKRVFARTQSKALKQALSLLQEEERKRYTNIKKGKFNEN